MKRFIHTIALAVFVAAIAGCSKEPSTTSADAVAPASSPAASTEDKVNPAPAPDAVPAPKVKITVPAGTKLRVALLDGLSSDKNKAGDQFQASLMEPVIVDGKTILARGTKVRGRVVEAKESGRVKGRASLELTLTQVLGVEGKSVAISTKPYMQVAESTKKRDAGIIAGGAGLGAAIGAIAGGGKGAAIGAGVGGGAGTGTVLATKGKEVRFPPEHPLSFTLAKSIEI
jgi:hypothetical protein